MVKLELELEEEELRLLMVALENVYDEVRFPKPDFASGFRKFQTECKRLLTTKESE